MYVETLALKQRGGYPHMDNPQSSLLAKNATRCCNREKNMYKRFFGACLRSLRDENVRCEHQGEKYCPCCNPGWSSGLILETLVDRHIPNLKI